MSKYFIYNNMYEKDEDNKLYKQKSKTLLTMHFPEEKIKQNNHRHLKMGSDYFSEIFNL